MTTVPELPELDARVLRALRSIQPGGTYLTPIKIAVTLGVERDVVRSALERLRDRDLATDDGERPRGFARTRHGDHALGLANVRQKARPCPPAYET